jgi:hypothetical protein
LSILNGTMHRIHFHVCAALFFFLQKFMLYDFKV